MILYSILYKIFGNCSTPGFPKAPCQRPEGHEQCIGDNGKQNGKYYSNRGCIGIMENKIKTAVKAVLDYKLTSRATTAVNPANRSLNHLCQHPEITSKLPDAM